MAHHRLASLYYIIHILHSGMQVLPGTEHLAVFLTESFISIPLFFITSSPEDVVEPLGEPSAISDLGNISCSK